jgi:hypothetical protein
LQRTSALQEAATSFRALRLPIDCIKDHVREGIRGVDASVENPGCRREAFDRRQASGDIRQSPISDLRISRRIRMHNLVGNPLAQEILVKRQENVHEVVVDAAQSVENFIEVLWIHQCHRNQDVLAVMLSDVPQRRDRKTSPDGAGTVARTRNPISSGSKINACGRCSRSFSARVVFPAPKGPLIQIIMRPQGDPRAPASLRIALLLQR